MNAYSFLPVDELIQPLPVSPHLLRSNKQDWKVQSSRDPKPAPKKKPGSPAPQLPSLRMSPHEVMLAKSPSEKHMQPISKQKQGKRLAFTVGEGHAASGLTMKCWQPVSRRRLRTPPSAH